MFVRVDFSARGPAPSTAFESSCYGATFFSIDSGATRPLLSLEIASPIALRFAFKRLAYVTAEANAFRKRRCERVDRTRVACVHLWLHRCNSKIKCSRGHYSQVGSKRNRRVDGEKTNGKLKRDRKLRDQLTCIACSFNVQFHRDVQKQRQRKTEHCNYWR